MFAGHLTLEHVRHGWGQQKLCTGVGVRGEDIECHQTILLPNVEYPPTPPPPPPPPHPRTPFSNLTHTQTLSLTLSLLTQQEPQEGKLSL